MTKEPTMEVGRYAGKKISTLPNSYLRWIIGQDFPKEILEAAKEKLSQSDYNDLYLHVSRHALDMFSKRFLFKWLQNENDKGDAGDGLASYVAKRAQEAWERGEDISLHRHQDDGVVKLWGGVKWVFGVNPNFPDYRDVITVMVDDRLSPPES